MKILAIIALMIVSAFAGMIVVLVKMGISSRQLWEYKNQLEKENRELLK